MFLINRDRQLEANQTITNTFDNRLYFLSKRAKIKEEGTQIENQNKWVMCEDNIEVVYWTKKLKKEPDKEYEMIVILDVIKSF